MSGKISSAVSSFEKLDVSKMSFEERLQYGAENAVRCMGVTSHDRVFIITDYERESIARRIAIAALDRLNANLDRTFELVVANLLQALAAGHNSREHLHIIEGRPYLVARRIDR